MTSQTNARLFDRVRRRIPESWRFWVYGRIKNSMRARRLLHGWLINRKEQTFIENMIGASVTQPWHAFEVPKDTLGYTERVVEIPWVLSRYQGEQRVLDVGTSFALPVYVRALRKLGIPDLRGVDIAPGDRLGIPMTKADVRRMPFTDGQFELILCISTLEHIGRDESPDAMTDGDLEALREMRRVLSSSGRILVTVPFGQPEIHSWFRQYDLRGWRDLTMKAGLQPVEQAHYLYSPVDGWRRAVNPGELEHASYQTEGATAASGLLCASLVRDSSGEFS